MCVYVCICVWRVVNSLFSVDFHLLFILLPTLYFRFHQMSTQWSAIYRQANFHPMPHPGAKLFSHWLYSVRRISCPFCGNLWNPSLSPSIFSPGLWDVCVCVCLCAVWVTVFIILLSIICIHMYTARYAVLVAHSPTRPRIKKDRRGCISKQHVFFVCRGFFNSLFFYLFLLLYVSIPVVCRRFAIYNYFFRFLVFFALLFCLFICLFIRSL